MAEIKSLDLKQVIQQGKKEALSFGLSIPKGKGAEPSFIVHRSLGPGQLFKAAKDKAGSSSGIGGKLTVTKEEVTLSCDAGKPDSSMVRRLRQMFQSSGYKHKIVLTGPASDKDPTLGDSEGLGVGPDVAMTPSPAGPVPIPYPNIDSERIEAAKVKLDSLEKVLDKLLPRGAKKTELMKKIDQQRKDLAKKGADPKKAEALVKNLTLWAKNYQPPKSGAVQGAVKTESPVRGLAEGVEDAMGKAIPTVISFLAGILGAGGLSGKVKQIIEKVRKPIDKAVDKVVGWLVARVKTFWDKLMATLAGIVDHARKTAEQAGANIKQASDNFTRANEIILDKARKDLTEALLGCKANAQQAARTHEAELRQALQRYSEAVADLLTEAWGEFKDRLARAETAGEGSFAHFGHEARAAADTYDDRIKRPLKAAREVLLQSVEAQKMRSGQAQNDSRMKAQVAAQAFDAQVRKPLQQARADLQRTVDGVRDQAGMALDEVRAQAARAGDAYDENVRQALLEARDKLRANVATSAAQAKKEVAAIKKTVNGAMKGPAALAAGLGQDLKKGVKDALGNAEAAVNKAVDQSETAVRRAVEEAGASATRSAGNAEAAVQKAVDEAEAVINRALAAAEGEVTRVIDQAEAAADQAQAQAEAEAKLAIEAAQAEVQRSVAEGEAEVKRAVREVERGVRDSADQIEREVDEAVDKAEANELSEIQQLAEKIAALNQQRVDIREQIAEAQDKLSASDDPEEQEKLKEHIEELEQKLATLGDDAQLANIDLQNKLQQMQQVLQTISNVSKMLHDTAMAIIRKIG